MIGSLETMWSLYMFAFLKQLVEEKYYEQVCEIFPTDVARIIQYLYYYYLGDTQMFFDSFL